MKDRHRHTESPHGLLVGSIPAKQELCGCIPAAPRECGRCHQALGVLSPSCCTAQTTDMCCLEYAAVMRSLEVVRVKGWIEYCSSWLRTRSRVTEIQDVVEVSWKLVFAWSLCGEAYGRLHCFSENLLILGGEIKRTASIKRVR